MHQSHDDPIGDIVQTLRQAESILFITGAGISADSGLPTYRGIGGLYDVEVTDEGYPIEEVLSGTMFYRRPELTWKYLAQIAAAARGATFNRGHEVIAEAERVFPRVWTLTQNVDGFHRQAGAQRVIEIHGNLHFLQCEPCGKTIEVVDLDDWEIPPRCPDCHAILRPQVVLFGEMLPEAAMEILDRELARGFDVVFSVGTSSVFPYIQMPIVAAKGWGATTVEINPSTTPISGIVDHYLPMRAAEALDTIWDRFQTE